MKLLNTKKISHDEWLEMRNKGIGGSDCGAIMSQNPWKSAVQLWLEKTGKLESPDISGKLAVKLGNKLEQAVAELFTEETGLTVKRNNHVLAHSEYPFMIANIDREGRDAEGKRFILECKTTGSYSGKEWEGDDIPLHYELQVLHYLIVTGYDYGYIACLIGNSKFVVKKVELDELIKARIIEEETKFWQCVLNDEMPPVDKSESCTAILSEMYPVANENTIQLDDEIDDLLSQRETLKSQAKDLDSTINYIENEIKARLQDNESGFIKGYKVTWKNVTSNRFDSKSFEKAYPDLAGQFKKQTISRRFEVKKLKGE